MEENNIVIPLKYKEGTFTLKDITVSDGRFAEYTGERVK